VEQPLSSVDYHTNCWFFFCGGIWKACEAFFWGQASWYNQKSEMDRSLSLGLGWPTMATNAIVTIAAGSSPVAWRLK